jgi:hypothetical protein
VVKPYFTPDFAAKLVGQGLHLSRGHRRARVVGVQPLEPLRFVLLP